MYGMFKFTCLLVILTLVVAEDPKVCINDGCLVGVKENSRSGREFNSFLGVPYAKPPVGNLRFRPPEKPDPWDTIEAKRDGNICIQSIHSRKEDDPPSSEDCLYLNLFTPKVPNEGHSDKPLPVMVFFHPGAWMYWSGTRDYFGGNYFLDRDVILVTVNYRLNIFGFLSTGDEVSPGNWGLKDQTHALRWVKENIAAFGGDPDNVTIIGVSAGAVSVHLHMLSPLSQGLFHRAIAQSGNALACFAVALEGEPRADAERIGKHLNCPTDNSTILVDCLRSKPVDDLMNSDPILFTWNAFPVVTYQPTVEPDHEGAFLLGRPRDLIKQGKITDVPFLTGVTSKEGIVLSGGMIGDEQILEDLNDLSIKSFPASLFFYQQPIEKIRKTIEKIKYYYFDGRKLTSEEADGITDMFSDRYFIQPLAETMEMQRSKQKSPIFVYHFEYISPISFATHFVHELNGPYNGSAHCDDTIFLFPMETTFFKGYVHNEEGNAMIERMLDLWINFAVHSNPTPEGYDFTWSPVNSSSHEYLAIKGPSNLEMTSNFYADRAAFWEGLNLEGITSIVHDEF